MDYREQKGVAFEFGVTHRLKSLERGVIIAQFPVFSFSLRRPTPIDVLALVSSHVIVLELKGISTKLCGNHSDRTWQGVTSQRTYQLFNPVIQVKEKVRSLQRKFRERGLCVSDFIWEPYVIVPKYCEINADRSIVKTDEELSLVIDRIGESPKGISEDVLRILMTGGVVR